MFPNDKILRKMLLDEFRYNRRAKLPLEYDLYDSDQEDHVKKRMSEAMQDRASKHKAMSIEDLVFPDK